jgi:hypothetical protein
MPRHDDPALKTIRESFSDLNVDMLKPLAALVGEAATKKGELVDLLAGAMEDRQKVQALYASLNDVAQKAVQEATHTPAGILHTERFRAKYGALPAYGGDGRRYGGSGPPARLRLFFPHDGVLPRDLRAMLREFVPQPPPLRVESSAELPSPFRRPHVYLGPYHDKPDETEVELTVRQTARPALHDVKAVLRLIDAGNVRVGDKTRRPAQAAMKAVTEVLAEGDFYTEADQSKYDFDPAADLQIQAFAWPMLLQAAGLAEAAGTRLQLTAAGRKATAKPAHEVIRQVWQKWQKTTLVDEFNRINVIKGQQAKGRGLTAVAPRRQAVVGTLRRCPTEKWIAIDALFRVLKAQAERLEVTHDPWKLYLVEQQYGSFGYDARFAWETLEGRFVLAFLFEYAASLGLLDVASIPPAGARNDFRDRWGTDDYSCLSRYDGLMYVRINPLGAWCLELAEHYEPEPVRFEPLFKVLPNRDVVAAEHPLGPADVLFLERFAERTSDAVWRLEAGKILEAVEKGMMVAELKEFLEAKSAAPLPHTVEVFLDDLADKTGKLADGGTARLIECAEPHVAELLAHDRKLRNLCQRAGERQLVFRAVDESAVRRALRELGYVLPPPR